jgi:hypothetical protein
LFFGGFVGGIAFHPERLVESTYIPPVVLTDFHSAGAPVDGARSLTQKSINYAKSVALKQPQNNFSIQFSALSYVNPAANRYRYRLEGLDRDWNETSSDRRQVSYTTLPLGSYQFQVQGATGRGPWSDPGATLDIEILPVWWQTWWLRGIVVLAVIAASVGAAMGAYRVRVATIKEREREFRMLAENAPDMVVRFDRAPRYRYSNPMSEQYLGIKQEELLGKTNETKSFLKTLGFNNSPIPHDHNKVELENDAYVDLFGSISLTFTDAEAPDFAETRNLTSFSQSLIIFKTSPY